MFQYGEIEEMNVCDNMGDHLVGNVYVKVCSCCESIDYKKMPQIMYLIVCKTEDLKLKD